MPGIALAVAAALSTAPVDEPADESADVLGWSAPATCPSQEQVVAAIAANLGRPLAQRDAAALTARAVARARPDGRWQLALRLEPRGEPAVRRTVIAEQCALLADAVGLIVAVAIDPALAGGPPRPAATPTSRAPIGVPLAVVASARRGSMLVPARPRPPPPVPSRARRLRASLAAAAALDVGALPRPAPGLLVRLGLLARRVRGELGVVHWFAQPARLAGEAGGGDLRITAARLQACPRLALRRVELPVCGGLELGAMRGQGVGVAAAAVDRVVWLALLADARALWVPIPRLALGLELGLAAPLLAARFTVRGAPGDLHRAAPVGFRGALTIELRFP